MKPKIPIPIPQLLASLVKGACFKILNPIFFFFFKSTYDATFCKKKFLKKKSLFCNPCPFFEKSLFSKSCSPRIKLQNIFNANVFLYIVNTYKAMNIYFGKACIYINFKTGPIYLVPIYHFLIVLIGLFVSYLFFKR